MDDVGDDKKIYIYVPALHRTYMQNEQINECINEWRRKKREPWGREKEEYFMLIRQTTIYACIHRYVGEYVSITSRICIYIYIYWRAHFLIFLRYTQSISYSLLTIFIFADVVFVDISPTNFSSFYMFMVFYSQRW